MTSSIWNDLCNQPTQPVSTEKYISLIHDSTTQLHQPIQLILSALDRRAMALTKLANFESALRDAQVMQQLSPSSALGYLREADIYSEQGKQHRVIDVCSKGLSLVDSNDPGYTTLQHMKAAAMQQQNKRIDFITQLPVDIVASTIIPMFMDASPMDSLTPYPYLHVSNQWRDYILQHSDGLSFKTNGGAQEPDMEKCSQLIRFARHIKELHVRQYADGTWLPDLLRDNDFCSLREIHLDEVSIGYMDQFISSLQSVASTLTHLSVYDSLNEMAPMDKILSTCPNLVSLTLRQPDLVTFKRLPMTTWPNLTTLSITGEGTLTRNDIVIICRRFPALKNLELHSCPNIKTALMIPKYCPLLKRAEIDIDTYMVGVRYVDSDTGSDEVVVTKLSVYIDDFEEEEGEWYFEELSPFIRRHHATLEEIKWNITPEGGFEDLDNIQYPRLKTLSLLSNAPSIVQNAPLLEELTLSANAIEDNSALLDTIPSTLKTLKLKLGEIPDDLDTNAIAQCLYRVSKHCQLHELAIRFGDSHGFPDVLLAIYSLKTLQRLTLGFCWHWKPHEMEGFLVGLVNGCPSLSYLEIQCINAPSTYSINALKRLAHLKELAFSIKDMDHDDSFWHALETFPQLRCIRVYHNDPVNMIPINRLSAHRPHMDIIIDSWFEPF